MSAITLGAAGAAASAGSGVTLALTNKTDAYVGAANGLAGFRFDTDGAVHVVAGAFDVTDEWIDNHPVSSTIADDYEVAYTQLVSGTGPSTLAASLGVYVAISSNRTWSLTSATSTSGVWRFRIREIADTANFVEADLTADITITP